MGLPIRTPSPSKTARFRPPRKQRGPERERPRRQLARRDVNTNRGLTLTDGRHEAFVVNGEDRGIRRRPCEFGNDRLVMRQDSASNMMACLGTSAVLPGQSSRRDIPARADKC